MKLLVTGAHGKVGRALVPALMRAGHDVRATDITRPTWDRLETRCRRRITGRLT